MRAAMIMCTSPTRATAMMTSPTASETNCRWRAWRFCSRCGSRLMRTMSLKAAQGEPTGDQQQRRVAGKLPGPDPVRYRHARERVADDRVDAGPLGHELVERGHQRAPAGE